MSQKPLLSGLLLILLALLSSCSSSNEMTMNQPDQPTGPMPIFEKAIGTFEMPVATTDPEAQRYVDQGVQMMFSFAKGEAPRAFEEAIKRDSTCAMCYWGHAWTLGPYLNGAMRADDAPKAFASITRASELASDILTPLEKRLIDAMAVRYEPVHDEDKRRGLDSLYAVALESIYEEYPEDLLVGTLFGEALMLLEPRRGMIDAEKPELKRIHKILEGVLALDITHPGACHLYIHATEGTTAAHKAQACADVLGNSIPGASHINHMPSHTYSRVGRWGESVTANLQAWHSDLKAEYDEGFAIYPSHNLHMLLFAASMDGQGAIAIQAGKDYKKLMRGNPFYQALTLVRFGRFDEVLEIRETPKQPIFRGFMDFARGYAQLRSGNRAKAMSHRAALQKSIRKSAGERFRGHEGEDLLGIVDAILGGELQRESGDLEGAIQTFRAAVPIEDSLRYDEPEPLNFSVRTWLGAALHEAGDFAAAEEVFRDALIDHPNNGWDLLGLIQALEAQEKSWEAETVRLQFDEAWARSDTWIRTPRF